MNVLGSLGATWARQAFGTLAPLLTSTAPVWAFPIVLKLWHFSLALGGMVTFALLLLSGGRQMAGEEGLGQGVLLPLLLSAVFLFGSLRFSVFLIRLNNALIAGLGRGAVAHALPPPQGVRVEDDLLFWLPYVVLLLLLSVVYLVRSVELMFLVALSPLGLVALAWPVSRAIGSRFLREFVVVVFVQAAQAFLLVLSRGLSGLEGKGSPQNGLLGLVVLYVLIRAPSYLRRWTAAGFEDASARAMFLRWMEF